MDSSIYKNYFSVFRNIIREMHSRKNLKDVLNLATREMAEVLEARSAAIRFFDQSSQQFELHAAWKMDKCYFSNGPDTSKRLQQLIHEDEKIHFIRDIHNAPELIFAQEAWDKGIRLIMEIPLTLGPQILGVMHIYFIEERRFSNDQLDFFLTVSEQLSCIIGRLQCAEIIEAQYNHLAKYTEKMSSLGRMAAGIAHEINNPLAGILLYSSNMVKKVPELSPLKEGLDIIISETTRCKGIIQGLLEFSRDQEPQKVLTDVNAIVKKSLQILKNEFYIHHITVKQDLAENLIPVFLDGNQIEQVMVNILLNAIHAIGKNGNIIIKTSAKTLQGNLEIQISDTGCGITQDHIDKIFEPFFSTKASGTGLGLAVSYGIISNHQGDIKVESQPGQGSCFTITLPVQTLSDRETSDQVSL